MHYISSLNIQTSSDFIININDSTNNINLDLSTINFIDNNPKLTLKAHGGAVQLTGTEHNINSINTVSFSSHTIEVWINTGLDDNTTTEAIFSTEDTNSVWSMMSERTDGKIRVEITNDGTNFKQYDSSILINDGMWHHIAYTYDTSTDDL